MEFNAWRLFVSAAAALCAPCTVIAGTLDAPAPPTAAASAMYTVTDLYNRLTTGAAGSKRSGPFLEPSAAPGPTGHTIDEIMAVSPRADNANGATSGNVLAGRTFWALRSDGSWGPMAGTIPTQTLTATTTAVPAGYYGATTLNTVDPKLATNNIRAGVTIFGVSGKPEVVDTTETTSPATAGEILANRKAFVNGASVTGTITSGSNVTGSNGVLSITIPDGLYSGGKTVTAVDANLTPGNIRSGVTIFGVTSTAPPAPLLRSGQTVCYSSTGSVVDCTGTGQDGALRKGIAPPPPRFTDNNDGTITDKATGLIWLRDANCFGQVNWSTALIKANSLADGSCRLTDGSNAGQWRLPNIKELLSLIDYGQLAPALPSDYPFTNVQYSSSAAYYWSATSSLYSTSSAWCAEWYRGNVIYSSKSTGYLVWPVRGGQ